MKEFNLKSGTKVIIQNDKMSIIRNENSPTKSLTTAAKIKSDIVIKLSAISSMIKSEDYLLICGNGLPMPGNFKATTAVELKQYPNCMKGNEAELQEIYDYLYDLI